MSDREEFTEARAAGLKARHETRLARAQAVIPDAALIAAAEALADEAGLGNDCGFDAQWRRRTAHFALEAALPHLRPHETREARAIRKQVAKEIAAALEAQAAYATLTAVEHRPGSREEAELAGASGGLKLAAQIAREIGSKEAGE